MAVFDLEPVVVALVVVRQRGQFVGNRSRNAVFSYHVFHDYGTIFGLAYDFAVLAVVQHAVAAVRIHVRQARCGTVVVRDFNGFHLVRHCRCLEIGRGQVRVVLCASRAFFSFGRLWVYGLNDGANGPNLILANLCLYGVFDDAGFCVD